MQKLANANDPRRKSQPASSCSPSSIATRSPKAALRPAHRRRESLLIIVGCATLLYVGWTLCLAERLISPLGETHEMVELISVSSIKTTEHEQVAPKPPPYYIYTKQTKSQNFTANNESSTRLLKPQQVLERYKAWHSVESLQRQPDGRNFAVAYYSCPLQAGNRLHHFFNGMLWAILTNRTLLWDYWDKINCAHYSGNYDKGICINANTVQDCDPILERLPWIPSYQEWTPKLGLLMKGEKPQPYQVPYWATHLPNNNGRKNRHAPTFHEGDDKRYAGVDVWLQNTTLVAFPQMVAKIKILEQDKHREYFLHSQAARTRAADLYSQGTDFLYGMLFRGSFRFGSELWQETLVASAASSTLPSNETFSVALHSRHSGHKDDGCNIAQEKTCLDKVLAGVSNVTNPSSCHVVVMSDRICTLQEVSRYVQNTSKCHVEMARHVGKATRSWRWEHGPFAGVGYYQDWILASRARNAFVGTRRSSSDLIKELMEYDRHVEAAANNNQIGPLLKCRL